MQTVSLEQSIKTGQSCACFNLRRAARNISQIYDQALRPSGLRTNQFSMMMATRALEPVTIKQLAEVVLMDRTTMGRNLKPLEKRGLIRVEPGRSDRRERYVSLTEQGHATLKRAYPLWQAIQKKVVDRIGELQFGSLLSLLQTTAGIGA